MPVLFRIPGAGSTRGRLGMPRLGVTPLQSTPGWGGCGVAHPRVGFGPCPAITGDGGVNTGAGVQGWPVRPPSQPLYWRVEVTEHAGNWLETGIGQIRWDKDGAERLKPTRIRMGGLGGSAPLG